MISTMPVSVLVVAKEREEATNLEITKYRHAHHEAIHIRAFLTCSCTQDVQF
jgi:hypothetical protein